MKTYVRVYSGYTIKSDYLGNFDDWGEPSKTHIDYEVNFDTLEVIRVTPEKEVIKWQQGLKVRGQGGTVTWQCVAHPEMPEKRFVVNSYTGSIFPVDRLTCYDNSEGFDPSYWEVVA